jgi:hypothetical protein
MVAYSLSLLTCVQMAFEHVALVGFGVALSYFPAQNCDRLRLLVESQHLRKTARSNGFEIDTDGRP